MIAWMFAAAALAGTIELDNGAVITGSIATWGREGCAVEMDTGPLAGLEVTMPCERIVAYRRGPQDGALAAVVEPASVVEPEPVAAAPAPVAAAPAPVAAPVVAAVEEPRRPRLLETLQSEWRGVKGDLGFESGEAEAEAEGDE